MKKINIYFFLILSSLILNNCGSVKDAMDPQTKNNTDEFLIEKKSPLSLPPDFEKLPIPENEKMVEKEDEENNLKQLIVNNQINSSEISDDTNESIVNFEKSLIEKIKNN